MLNTTEAAKYLGLTTSYFRNLRTKGFGPISIKVAGNYGRFLYRKSWLDSWLAAKTIDQHNNNKLMENE
jgi:hypothetical protein